MVEETRHCSYYGSYYLRLLQHRCCSQWKTLSLSFFHYFLLLSSWLCPRNSHEFCLIIKLHRVYSFHFYLHVKMNKSFATNKWYKIERDTEDEVISTACSSLMPLKGLFLVRFKVKNDSTTGNGYVFYDRNTYCTHIYTHIQQNVWPLSVTCICSKPTVYWRHLTVCVPYIHINIMIIKSSLRHMMINKMAWTIA